MKKNLIDAFTKWPHCVATYFALALLVAMLVLCTGCQSKGTIRAGGNEVVGVPNAGTPATLATSNAGTAVPLPAGSTVTVTKVAAQPAQPATKDTPAVAAQPAKEVTVIAPAGPTEYRKTEATVTADTGTVDTSVAKHQIDVADRRWLLFVAIGCGLCGVVARSMLPAWPSLSNGLLLAAVLAGLAWKLADVPSWIWMVALAVVGLLVLGYKRAEWDKNKDGIPDALQK